VAVIVVVVAVVTIVVAVVVGRRHGGMTGRVCALMSIVAVVTCFVAVEVIGLAGTVAIPESFRAVCLENYACSSSDAEEL
jgi:hypothetical protein